MIPVEISKLRENITDRIKGTVTGTAKYGVFCEFNTCLTGMIHVNDLDEETFKRHKSQSIKPGEEIEFLVKEIVSNTKITLTQKTLEETNPWINILERYKVPSTIDAKVKAVKDYGIFVTLEEGVVGLLHISEVGEDLIKVFKNGDNITVQVTRIDPETRKVFLKLPS
jgi:small subunit ribosomal protein S1